MRINHFERDQTDGPIVPGVVASANLSKAHSADPSRGVDGQYDHHSIDHEIILFANPGVKHNQFISLIPTIRSPFLRRLLLDPASKTGAGRVIDKMFPGLPELDLQRLNNSVDKWKSLNTRPMAFGIGTGQCGMPLRIRPHHNLPTPEQPATKGEANGSVHTV
jgi:hypothetical protein